MIEIIDNKKYIIRVVKRRYRNKKNGKVMEKEYKYYDPIDANQEEVIINVKKRKYLQNDGTIIERDYLHSEPVNFLEIRNKKKEEYINNRIKMLNELIEKENDINIIKNLKHKLSRTKPKTCEKCGKLCTSSGLYFHKCI